MFNTSFSDYVPVLNAFLNSQVDSTSKTWQDVVGLFFEINKDSEMLKLTGLAKAFENVAHPNYPRILSTGIEKYFTETLTTASLMEVGLEPKEDFIDDNDGLRLTFAALRRFIFRRGDYDLMDSFDFIDNVYQTYVRYTQTMRSKQPTHWTLVERVSGFTKSMQPQNPSTGKKPRPATMNAQPRVFCIVKGTYKSISTRLSRYAREETAFHQRVAANQDAAPLAFVSTSIIPIYEKVLPDINAEISAVLSRLGESSDESKNSVRLLKQAILIDPSQEEYTPNMLAEDIADTRLRIKEGRATSAIVEKKSVENFSDLSIFSQTNGRFMDDLMIHRMTPRNDDVCLVKQKEKKRAFPKWRAMGAQRSPVKAEIDETQPVTPPASFLRTAVSASPTVSKRVKPRNAPKALVLDGYADSSDNEERPRRWGKRLFQVPTVQVSTTRPLENPEDILANEGY